MPAPPDTLKHRAAILGPVLCSGLLIDAVWIYPLGGYWLAIGLLVYLLILNRWPHAWLILLPAALPVLDFTPWTGHFFFDELDCMLAATVAMNGWRSQKDGQAIGLSRLGILFVVLLGLSYFASTVIGASPFPKPDLNSFNNYYSPYNALRVSKGFVWALFLAPMISTELGQDTANNTNFTQRRFALGMTCGVLAATLGVLWERAAFTGLLNFSSGYRVVGLFSGMHTGGAYIEAYFTTSLPFVAWWTFTSQARFKRSVGTLIFAAGTYALAVTYARGGYLAFAFGMSVLVLGFILQNKIPPKPMHLLHGLFLLALLLVVVWPIMEGTAMHRRYAVSQRDWHTREAHWLDALRMMDDTAAVKLFGMGIGSYPRTYYLRNSENIRSGMYALATEGDRSYLLLAAGEPIYVEQLVNLQREKHYRLSFSARSLVGEPELTLPICEKWMLYSSNCSWQSIKIEKDGEQWQNYSIDVNGKVFPQRHWYSLRTIKFSMFNNAEGSLIAVTNISLRGDDGVELLSNGNFIAGMDHWFFASDNHQPWHLENLWVQIYFEQGGFGLLAFAALITYTCIALWKRQRENDLYAWALAASLAAFLTLSSFDSLFDFPRMSTLFYLLVFQALLRKKTPTSI